MTRHPVLYRPMPWRLVAGATLCCMGPLFAEEPAVSSPAAPVPQHTPAREFHDLPYVTNGAPNQRLALVLPSSPGGQAVPVPLVVWIHGGGWEQGSYHQNPARGMASRGYAVASIGYRFSSQATYPAQIEDCKAAIRWLRAHAAEYAIDPARIGVWGASAGGHLAALLGTSAKEKRFDVGDNLDRSSAVQCVIDSFGPTDFLHWGDPPATPSEDTAGNALGRLLGGKVTDHLDLARLASPIDFVDRDSAPFLILHGKKDPIVPLQQSVVFDAALRAAGVESTLVVVPDGGHGDAAFNDPKYLRQMAEFMDKHLLGHAAAR